MTIATPSAAVPQLVQFILDKIPLARAMKLQPGHCDDDSVTLLAPLAPNINDKGCAFGGSLASVMTLSGWALVERELRQHGQDCDVLVGTSNVRYLAPLWQDFRSEARLAEGAQWAAFFDTLNARGRARIEVECVVPGNDGQPAATLSARFVAKRRG